VPKKLPKGKVVLLVYIDEELRNRLYEFVKAKYSGFRGGLSIEVQNAIARYLSEQALAAHTKTRINPGFPKVQRKIDAIIAKLREWGFVNQFSIKDWKKACYHVVGHDPRTVRKYLKTAEQLGRIKFYAGSIWEII